MTSLIKAINISYKYPEQNEYTLKDISFELNAGESLGILGPNGGGKSTLMKILSGILVPATGNLEILSSRISYIPQTSSLNLTLPLKAYEYLEYAAKAMKIDNYKIKIAKHAKDLGIDHKLNYSFKDMSGGEMQRVLICKALLNDPQILLLDEPTKGLDSLGQDQLLNNLKDIKIKHNASVVIVDHNINQIIRHCDKVLCLNKTSHWHEHKDLLTKNILENIYHCEFEHLLIHQNESSKNHSALGDHQFCNHDHEDQKVKPAHSFIRRMK